MIKTYDTQDAVPEALRASAIETKDGKWLVDEPAKTEQDVAKLSETLEKEREQRKAEEKRAKAAEKERDDLKRAKDAKEQGVSEEALAKLRLDEENARKPIIEESERLKAENRKLKLTDRVQKLALGAGVMEERLEDAMLHLERRTDLGDADGIVFKDKDGKVTADDANSFFAKFKAEKPWLFAGTQAAGGPGGVPAGTPKADPNAMHPQAVNIRSAF